MTSTCKSPPSCRGAGSRRVARRPRRDETRWQRHRAAIRWAIVASFAIGLLVANVGELLSLMLAPLQQATIESVRASETLVQRQDHSLLGNVFGITAPANRPASPRRGLQRHRRGRVRCVAPQALGDDSHEPVWPAGHPPQRLAIHRRALVQVVCCGGLDRAGVHAVPPRVAPASSGSPARHARAGRL